MVNGSLAAAHPTSPFLVSRAAKELGLISQVREQYANRFAVVPVQAHEPVGVQALEALL